MLLSRSAVELPFQTGEGCIQAPKAADAPEAPAAPQAPKAAPSTVFMFHMVYRIVPATVGIGTVGIGIGCSIWCTDC